MTLIFLRKITCFRNSRHHVRYDFSNNLARSKVPPTSPVSLEQTSTSGPIISYYTLANQNPYETLYVIKNSKFITKIFYAESIDNAISLVNKYKDDKASHNCWAYRDNNIERVSDDGEPGGTAGRPILSAIQEHKMMNTLILVTRFFGGIKLGTGGLSRAYATATQQVISECQKKSIYETLLINLISKTVDLGTLYQIITSINNNCMSKYGINVIERLEDEIYNTNEDTVSLNLLIHSFVFNDLQNKVVDMTKGRGSVKVNDK